ncbi:glycosyltransferase family 4 protein [Candidatus Nitrosopumilus sediminis]|uniref:Glycosyl transferase family protein n=1 Tax=Candidatus Nitrosopumilus sediminis TaxID=1229909 RepID=K0BC16_9ARCH|nr:glycosyltransferase family 4 protein [Candidatus Nitrosopumilus sediminis]AFS81876.1 glycosyl transferase family protein [Candidatus Nitrosopumilus sediminis]
MKIGIIHQFLDLLGGAERTTSALIDALKKTNHDITLYTSTDTEFEKSKKFEIKKINSTMPYLWKLKKQIENKKIYSKVNDQDLIIVMDGGFGFRFLPRKKIILYCHSTFEYEKKFIDQKIPGWRGILYKIVQNDIKNNLKHFNEENIHLISNSEFTKNSIKKLFGVDSKIIYPPVNLELFSNKIVKTEKVVSITRYAPEKNFTFFSKILKCCEVDFSVIGNSKLKQIEFYDDLKKQLENYKNIHLYNNISQKSLIEILFSSKVYFHPSIETFGISVVESIASGCIPIVPDNSAHKETVPFEELRYKENDENDAKMKIEAALRGDFDKYLPELKRHIEKFQTKKFQRNILEFIEEIMIT